MEKIWAVVTGASGSMGREAVRFLAQKGHPVVMACRNLRKGEAVRQEILASVPDAELELRMLDLGSLRSVQEFAASFEGEKICRLFNNAGVISRGYSVTEDGFENTLQVNYIGPYLLTRLLLPKMLPDAQIVNMVSLTHRFGRIRSNFFDNKDFNRLGIYSDTKLALLLFSIALSGKCTQTVNVSDPGIVDSNMISMGKWFDPLADLLFRPFCNSPLKGVRPALNALESDSGIHYFVGNKKKSIKTKYLKHKDLDRLWNQTQELLEQRGISLD